MRTTIIGEQVEYAVYAERGDGDYDLVALFPDADRTVTCPAHPEREESAQYHAAHRLLDALEKDPNDIYILVEAPQGTPIIDYPSVLEGTVEMTQTFPQITSNDATLRRPSFGTPSAL